jgi:predicted metal-dependent phosphoesterase TrpH
LIDLHLHTTASDGLLAPGALVARAAACGLTTISVTDHDTTAGVTEADEAARRHCVRLVPGVEITAVEDGRDVHMLAYFIDRFEPAFRAFLDAQRADRLRRVRRIAERLDALGCGIDPEPLLATGAGQGRSVGRPQLADALVAAGHARSRDDAFDRFLAEGAPAFVTRSGPSPETVIGAVRDAGGVVSIAHPGVTKMDHIIPRLVRAGLASLEARHSDHDPATETRYRQLAAEHRLATSGGSDFHGDTGRRADRLGAITISAEEFAQLESRRP